MEIDVTGVNPLTFPETATWEWHVAVYLFVGGLVAGIMIISAVLRLRRAGGFERATRIAEVVSLPLTAFGLLLLFFDLGNGWNSWRFYTTFEPTSAMSWGSWILLLVAIVLAARILIHSVDLSSQSGWWERRLERARRIGRAFSSWSRALDVVAVALGTALGIYTGILLSTIPARPLWDSFALAPLFLVSGVSAGGAFLSLFADRELHLRLVPAFVWVGIVELLVLAGFMATLWLGPSRSQAAADLLLGGVFAVGLWGLVVVMGILVPVVVERAQWTQRDVPGLLSRAVPYFKLSGGMVLRFVIVYAGLQSAL